MKNTIEYSETDKLIDDYVRPLMPSIPCKDTKCLKYPTCITKESIKCTLLKERFRDIQSEGSWSAWEIMRVYLPKLIFLDDDT